MAYADESNAGFRISAISGFGTFLGRIACLIEKIVERERIEADNNNVPVARPVDSIDARVTVDYLDTAGAKAETTAAANLTVTFDEADGVSSGSVVIGKVVGSSVQHTMARRRGGFGVQQTLELEGALTYTPTA